MLELTILVEENYDEESGRFTRITKPLRMEHSLAAISKWECIWEKAFLSKKDKTPDENLSYIQCMCLNEEDQDLIAYLTLEQLEQIRAYMNRKMTAAWFWDDSNSNNSGVTTAEDIYYLMFGNNIPLECENWHLGRLIALIQTFQEKNNPKKMTKAQIIARNKALNAERRARMNSKG